MKYYTAKQIFYINSSNRITGTHSSFSYYLNIDRNEDYDRVVVLAASIPKSYYLVDANHNHFTLKEGTDTILITFPTGNYSRGSLALKLQTLLNTNSPNTFTYLVTYPSVNSTNDDGKYVITVSGNGATQPEFIFTDEMYEQLGFNINSTNQFSGNTLISPNVINLTNETTLFIRLDICQNNEGNNILQEIYASGEATYSMINFENKAPMEYGKPIISKGSNVYSFHLTDEYGTLLDTNGININLTIMIYKNNDIDNLIRGAIKYFTLINGK